MGPDTQTLEMRDRGGRPLIAERIGHGGEAPMILIHCWAGHRGLWQAHREALARDRALLLPDLAGHGDSHREARDWSLGALADDVADWVDHSGLPEPLLVGHSMGGGVALEAGARLGARISGVVVIDTFGMDYGRIPDTEIAAFCEAMEQDFPAVVHQIVSATATERTSPDLQQSLVHEMSKADAVAATAAWRSLLSWDPLPAFAQCQAPVGMIQNGGMHADAAERYSAHIASERLMPGHGHFLHMEDPKRFMKLLDEVGSELLAA